eukprot:12921980-Ditylum_brightwellii.AAC.1
MQDRKSNTIWENKHNFPSNKNFLEKFALWQENYNDRKVSVFIFFKMGSEPIHLKEQHLDTCRPF